MMTIEENHQAREHYSTLIPYRSDIDGLRAIAVIAIICFHLSPETFPGGYLGVDVFFVLSGFLITRILLQKPAEARTFIDFYKRRAKRILPASIMVMIVLIIVGFFFFDPYSLSLLGKQVTFSQSFMANVFMWRNASDYWGLAAENLPLLHMWSLAVEEQFYLIFPLLFAVPLLRRHLPTLIISLISAGIVISVYGSVYHKGMAFYLAPFRAWEFLSCSVLAMLKKKHGLNIASGYYIRIAGLLLLVGVLICWDGRANFPFSGALSAVLPTLVLIGQREHLSDSDPPARILSIPLVVYIGKISYSLYLWHWPFFVIPLILGLPSALFWFFVPVSIISYHLIEKPFRQNGRIIIVLYGCVIVLIFGIVLGLGKVTGLRSFHYQMPRIAVEYDAQKFINDGGLVVNLRSKSWVLVLGNSMAYQHAKTINRAFSNFRIEYLTVGGTPTRFLLPGEDGTDRDPPIVWTHSERVSFDHLRKMRIESDPDFIIVSERWNFADVGEMQAVLSFLDYLSDHTNRLIILSETPNLEVPQGLNILSVEHRFHIRGNSETWAPVSPEFLRRSKGANLELSHFSEVREGVYFVPLDSHFLHGNYAWIADGQNLLYGNSSHLSLAGSMYLLDDFLGIMRSIVH